MDERLVKVVASKNNMRGPDFLSRNHLTLYKRGDYPLSRYEVFQGSQAVGTRRLIGFVFRECSVWVFVPDSYRSHPQLWFFGQTRYDAIAGYLDSTGAAPSEEVQQ